MAQHLTQSGWPKGMRVIVRKERPHPGAQLRFTDPDGHRYTAFATNTAPGGPGRQLADLELRNRRRARAEDRIRAAKDTGLRNLPLHGLDQNRIWQAVIALACDITAWTQMLALAEHPARRWEPKRPRLDLLPARRPRPSRPRRPAAPARLRTLDEPRDHRRDPAARARCPRLSPASPSRQPRGTRPARGTGAPSDLGRTVMPERQNPTSLPDQTPVKITNSTGTKDPGSGGQ